MTRPIEHLVQEPADVIRGLLRATAGGTGGVVVLDVEAALLGRAVLDGLVTEAASAGLDVLHVPPAALGRSASDDLVRRLGAPLPPPASRLDTPLVVRSRLDARQYLVVETIRDRIDERLGRGPVVLVVEDLAGADASMLAAIAACAPLTERTPLLVVAADFGDLDDTAVPALVSRWSATRVEVASPGDPAALAFEAVGDLATALRLAAAVGMRVDDVVLDALWGEEMPDLAAVVAPAFAAGVLVHAGGAVAFAHRELRRHWYARIPAPLRSTVHADVATTMRRLGALDDTVARHAVRSGAGDRETLALIVRVGSSFVAGAPHLARAHLVHADAFVDAGASGAFGVSPASGVDMAGFASGLAEVGELDRALARLAEAAPRIEGARLAEVHALRAQLLAMRGDPSGEALALLDAAIGSAEGDRQLAVLVLADASVLHLEAGDFARARAAADRALALAADFDEPWRTTDAWCTRAWLAMFALELDDAWACAEAAMLVAATGDGIAHRRSAPEFFAGLVLLDMDRLDDAGAMFDRARVLAEREGAAWAVPLAIFGQAYVAFVAGRWDDALALCESGSVLAEEIGSLLGVGFGAAIATIIELERDDVDAARTWLARARLGFGPGVPATGTDTMMLAEAMMAEADGRLDDAQALLSGAVAIGLALGMFNDLGDLAAPLIRVALARDDLAVLATTRHAFENVGSERAREFLAPAAARLRAVGDADLDAALEAVGATRVRRRPYDTALALVDAALVAARSGDERAPALLDEACTTFDSLGARRALLRAHADARRAGLAPRRRSGRTGTSTGWASLTPTELEVVRLVCDGATSRTIGERLFVSRRTVETHLQHVYTKLGVRSRQELAAFVAVRS